jgi:hypothetical protein
MSGVDSIPWEWVAALGGTACAGLCALVAVLVIAFAAWRYLRNSKPPEHGPALAPEGPETARILTTVLGYRRTDGTGRTRERWGRPIRYVRSETTGAHWSTPVGGHQLRILERNHKPGGPRTGHIALDQRFRFETDHPDLLAQLADAEVAGRLLALPVVEIQADGSSVAFLDPRLSAHQKSCTPHDPESADGLAMQVRLHDSVCDVLVMLADRLG